MVGGTRHGKRGATHCPAYSGAAKRPRSENARKCALTLKHAEEGVEGGGEALDTEVLCVVWGVWVGKRQR